MSESHHELSESRLIPLALAAWFALVGGIAEGGMTFIRRDLLGRTLHLGREAVWLPAIANLAYVLVPALVLTLAWRRLPRGKGLTAAIAIPATIAGAGLGLFWGRIHWAAGLVIGLGIAVQSVRFFAGRSSRLRLVWRTLPLLAAIVVIAILLVDGGRRVKEYRALRALPPAVSTGTPNVLVVVVDAGRWFEFGTAGYSRATTPEIDRRAQQGTVFDRAFSGAPWTLPGHATLLTGRWPAELGVDWRIPLDTKFPTLAESLRDRGIATVGVVANNTYCSYEHGIDRGFIYYRDYPVSLGMMVASSSVGRRISEWGAARRLLGYYEILGRKNAATINHQFLSWLDQRGPRPFFAMLNYFDVHEPYLPPPAWDRFGSGAPRKLGELYYVTGMAALPFKEQRPAAELQRERDAYDGALAYLDHEIGQLLDDLEHRHLLDNTLLIITADHGEQFGEHGMYEHGNSLYRGVMQVPLIVRWPGHVPSGKRVLEPVSLRDVPATIMAAVAPDEPTRFPGRSLLPLASSSDSVIGHAEQVFMDYLTEEGKPERGVITDGWQFMVRKDGSEELYSLEKDPAEANNLAAQPQMDSTRRALRVLVDSALTRTRRPRRQS